MTMAEDRVARAIGPKVVLRDWPDELLAVALPEPINSIGLNSRHAGDVAGARAVVWAVQRLREGLADVLLAGDLTP